MGAREIAHGCGKPGVQDESILVERHTTGISSVNLVTIYCIVYQYRSDAAFCCAAAFVVRHPTNLNRISLNTVVLQNATEQAFRRMLHRFTAHMASYKIRHLIAYEHCVAAPLYTMLILQHPIVMLHQLEFGCAFQAIAILSMHLIFRRNTAEHPGFSYSSCSHW